MADVIWVAEAPTTAHPLHGQNRTDAWLATRLHRRLFEPDGSSSLVTAHEVADGALRLTLGDARWSDGHALEAADVCATVDRLRDEAHPTRFTGMVRAAVSSCVVDDPHTATLALARTMADPRPWLVVPVLPAHRPDWTAWVPGPGPEPVAVGLGPDTARRDKHGWLLAGSLAGALRVTDDPAAAFRDKGRAALLEADDLPAVRALTGVEIRRWGDPVVWALVLDPTRPPFDDPAARARLDAALDREALAAAWFGRDAEVARQPWTVAAGPWPPGHRDAAPGVLPPLPGAADLRVEGAVVSPVALPAAAAAMLAGLTPSAVDARTWAWSVLAGGHGGTSVAALAPLEGPPCAWFETRTESRGPRNVYGFSDPEVDSACRAIDAGDPEASRTLHGLLTDRRPAVFLVSHQERWVVRP